MAFKENSVLKVKNVKKYLHAKPTLIAQSLCCPHKCSKHPMNSKPHTVCVSNNRFKMLSDINSNHFLLFNCGTRWLSFWLDFLSATVTLMVALFVVLSPNEAINPSLKGLTLSYTIQVTLTARLKQ